MVLTTASLKWKLCAQDIRELPLLAASSEVENWSDSWQILVTQSRAPKARAKDISHTDKAVKKREGEMLRYRNPQGTSQNIYLAHTVQTPTAHGVLAHVHNPVIADCWMITGY